MRLKNSTLFVMGFILSVMMVGPLQAKDKAPQMNEEMQAMMAKVKEAGTPSAGHEKLKALAGEWNTTTRTWMKPKAKPQKSTGTSSMAWVLDGRFLQQKFNGNWAGEKFEGLGFIGYDNVKQEYVSVWMDSMSTGIAESTGTYDAANKTIKDEGSFSCPLSETKVKNYRTEWKVINPDKNVFRMYTQDKVGKEFKSMEIVYKRVK